MHELYTRTKICHEAHIVDILSVLSVDLPWVSRGFGEVRLDNLMRISPCDFRHSDFP